MGPSSMLFGRGSTGGVINQVTKKPRLKQATELSVQGTTNGLVRDYRRRERAVRRDQRGARQRHVPARQGLDASTRPTCWTSASRRSVKLGIGTPTEITLRRDPAAQQGQRFTTACRRSTASRSTCRATSTTASSTTTPSRTSSSSTPRSTTSSTTTCASATRREFLWVNTSVRETSGGFVGILGPIDAGFVQAPHGPDDTPYSVAPLNQLYDPPAQPRSQHQRHHAGEPDRADGQVRHRPGRPSAADGRSTSTTSSYTQQDLSPGTAPATAFPWSAGSVGCTPAGFTVGAGTPGNVPSVPGNYAILTGLGAWRLFQRHDPGACPG